MNNHGKNFVPIVGMKTDNCYLGGIGVNDDICNRGVIEVVGIDYFVLRNLDKNTVRLVNKQNYWVIEEGNFYQE